MSNISIINFIYLKTKTRTLQIKNKTKVLIKSFRRKYLSNTQKLFIRFIRNYTICSWADLFNLLYESLEFKNYKHS
jgi:uncharacterized protein YnzC (UPF0291/DUF896 family)